MAQRFVAGQDGVAVQGLDAMQRVLRKVDVALALELQVRLREVGERVASVARGNVQHKTGRSFGRPKIEDSIKVGTTQRAASVYSLAPHGGAQNYGGQVGRHRSTLLKRAEVSQYMTKSVRSERAYVSARLEGVLDWLQSELEKGD